VIVLAGIPSEPPIRLVAAALETTRTPYAIWNQRDVLETHVSVSWRDGRLAGRLESPKIALALENVDGVYVRLMDVDRLPEVESLAREDERRRHAYAVHEALGTWMEATAARVVTRARAHGSNGSKPYQAMRIARHFRVPETLVTNDDAAVRDFAARHRRLIYKSMSGTRSIVRTLDAQSVERLDRIGWCPVQFQGYVEGMDVRVHTVRNDAVFATAVRSARVDYRYGDDDSAPELAAFKLPDAVATACLELAADLDLPVAGIDLRFGPDGQVWCFEVNPMPAFSYYESSTGQPIAAAIAHYLASGQASA
jgi:glutathione synthase/RimK-type ligase-like ATP-grasp enzyme